MLEYLDQLEGHLERLLPVKSWVALRLVGSMQVTVGKATASTNALSYVVLARHLKVDPTEPRPTLLVRLERLKYFRQDIIKRSSLDASIGAVPAHSSGVEWVSTRYGPATVVLPLAEKPRQRERLCEV